MERGVAHSTSSAAVLGSVHGAGLGSGVPNGVGDGAVAVGGPPPLSRAELAAAVQRSDPPAIRALVESVAPIVYRVVVSMLGREHADVDDAVQASLLTLIRRVGECRDDTIERFAVGVAVHTTLNVLRREKTRFRLLSRFSKLREDDEAKSPESTDVVLRRLLAELVASLPPEQAEAFVRRTVLEYSCEEIAQQTGVSVNTVRSRIRLARQALVRRIEADPRLVDLAARATASLHVGRSADE